jgi:hypothetical protein
VQLRFKSHDRLRQRAHASPSGSVGDGRKDRIPEFNLALNKLIALHGAFEAMEQRFVPIAVQTLGYRFTWRFDPGVTEGGKLLWISLSGNNGPHDPQARFSGCNDAPRDTDSKFLAQVTNPQAFVRAS